jgi:hypothetical protein
MRLLSEDIFSVIDMSPVTANDTKLHDASVQILQEFLAMQSSTGGTLVSPIRVDLSG